MEVEFDDIAKISSVLMWLDKRTQLSIMTTLWNNSKKKGRTSYHKEVRYYNESAGKQVVNITLEFKTYVIISQINSGENGEKCYLSMGIPEVYMLINALDSMYNILSTQYKSIFKSKNGSPFIDKKIKPVEINLSSVSNSYLVLTPDFITYRNGESAGGLRINLSSSTNYVILNLRDLIDIKEKLKTDIPLHGQAMVNYIGRPEFGYNMYQVGSGMDGEEDVVCPTKGRTVSSMTKNQKTQYFNLNGIL